MKLRNGKVIGISKIYNNTIDFEYASYAWRLNKHYLGYGQFCYK